MSRTLTLHAPAKINLTLRVGARRDDGFHDVRTLMQSIALADTLRMTTRRGPFVLQTRTPGVPDDRTNLVWRAADLLWRSIGRTGDPRDVHVRLEKSIPTEAGLGGGSADAAAALAGLNVLWEARRSQRDLARLGSELGVDVPFFLHGGTALGSGRGDELYPVDDVTRLGIVVIKPSFGVATAAAYRWVDEDRAAKVPDSESPGPEIDVGWRTGPIRLVNDLEPPVARRHPMIGEMVEALRRQGAQGAAMTGSGSAVFGVFSEANAKRAARSLQRPDWLICLSRTLTRRESARRIGV
jgi:4-diphosphocytidyl-2-C-methyl-D-erythritol kinase